MTTTKKRRTATAEQNAAPLPQRVAAAAATDEFTEVWSNVLEQLGRNSSAAYDIFVTARAGMRGRKLVIMLDDDVYRVMSAHPAKPGRLVVSMIIDSGFRPPQGWQGIEIKCPSTPPKEGRYISPPEPTPDELRQLKVNPVLVGLLEELPGHRLRQIVRSVLSVNLDYDEWCRGESSWPYSYVGSPPTMAQIQTLLESYEKTKNRPCETGTAWNPAPYDYNALGRKMGLETSKTRIGEIRRKLVSELGEMCHCCHVHPAIFVDHDHVSNRVRGVLCPRCNNIVDYCLHTEWCSCAYYLNDPPAFKFDLFYKGKQWRGSAAKFWSDYLETTEGRNFYLATIDPKENSRAS